MPLFMGSSKTSICFPNNIFCWYCFPSATYCKYNIDSFKPKAKYYYEWSSFTHRIMNAGHLYAIRVVFLILTSLCCFSLDFWINNIGYGIQSKNFIMFPTKNMISDQEYYIRRRYNSLFNLSMKVQWNCNWIPHLQCYNLHSCLWIDNKNSNRFNRSALNMDISAE